MTATNTAPQSRKEASNRSLSGPLDCVVLRAPLLPVEFYRALCDSDAGEPSLLEFLDNQQIRLAINSASPSLACALLSPSKTQKDRLRARRKFRRYLIRMSTRPTPFGAFAGVGIVPLGAQTTLKLDEARTRYHRHLDVPWLLEFLDSVESVPEIFPQLRFRVNPCTLVRGGRVYIRELTPLRRGGNGPQHASLRASHLAMPALSSASALIPT